MGRYRCGGGGRLPRQRFSTPEAAVETRRRRAETRKRAALEGGPTVSDRTLGRREAVRLLGMGPWRGKRVLEGREGGWSRR